MPNPTANPLFSQARTNGNNPIHSGQLVERSWGSMPLNPAGLVSMQSPARAIARRGWENWFQNWGQHETGDSAGASANNAAGSGLSVLPGPPAMVHMPTSSESSIGSNSGGGPENPGIGQYIPTDTYFMTPAGQAGIRGLGGLGCGCGCGGGCGCSQPGGMGTLGDSTGLLGSGLFNGNGVMGTGLFEGGFDPTTWGPAEWAVIALGGYVAFSVFYATKAGIGYASTVPTRARRAARGVKSSFL